MGYASMKWPKLEEAIYEETKRRDVPFKIQIRLGQLHCDDKRTKDTCEKALEYLKTLPLKTKEEYRILTEGKDDEGKLHSPTRRNDKKRNGHKHEAGAMGKTIELYD